MREARTVVHVDRRREMDLLVARTEPARQTRLERAEVREVAGKAGISLDKAAAALPQLHEAFIPTPWLFNTAAGPAPHAGRAGPGRGSQAIVIRPDS